MRLLYHLWLSPFSRKIRVVLKEKNLDFTMKVEKTWERRPEFLALNPAGDVPVLIEPDGTVLAEATAIAEFLDEVYRDKLLLGVNPVDRAEVRRLTAKRGVDVVFEHVGGATWEKLLPNIAPGGRLVTCGATAGYEAKVDIRFLFSKAIAILGVSRAVLFPAIVPAISVLIGIPIVGEWPDALQVAGLFLVTLGLLTAVGLFTRSRRSPRPPAPNRCLRGTS
jgi:hypothetical protein